MFATLGVVFVSLFPLDCVYVVIFFFFQAEDGIRDLTVTGVQTCALPICTPRASLRGRRARRGRRPRRDARGVPRGRAPRPRDRAGRGRPPATQHALVTILRTLNPMKGDAHVARWLHGPLPGVPRSRRSLRVIGGPPRPAAPSHARARDAGVWRLARGDSEDGPYHRRQAPQGRPSGRGD